MNCLVQVAPCRQATEEGTTDQPSALWGMKFFLSCSPMQNAEPWHRRFAGKTSFLTLWDSDFPHNALRMHLS